MHIGGTATGNYAVTATLAICSLLLMGVNGLRLGGKEYLAHFCPGPMWLAPLLVPIEIIGTIAKRDKPYPPRVEGMDAIDNFLTGLTNEIRQKERQEILSAKPSDIQALAPVVKEMIANANLCVYGNEELLREKKGLFGSLVPVIE